MLATSARAYVHVFDADGIIVREFRSATRPPSADAHEIGWIVGSKTSETLCHAVVFLF